ncbi:MULTISPECIES: hypothetical protein [Phaeobacter]|uniref:hypothetical protein n=1 Tax=Phaeobacter TaxID=302485 RepID=UPI00076BBD12|nr:hypothetical protein [Phaeobacter inhibens]KXF92109.1 hypothetical protein AT574_03910 [Phaeobacter inhibens]WHP69944.1 hypothetical protein QMZ01_07155 [Phaeobacter inhibens]
MITQRPFCRPTPEKVRAAVNDLVSGAHVPTGTADALTDAIMIKDPVHAGIVLRSLADVLDPEGA